MRPLAGFVFLLIGCGRVHFDPAPGGEADAILPTDGSLGCMPFDVSFPAQSSSLPAGVWIGNGYVFAVQTAADTSLVSVAADGTIGTSQSLVTHASGVAGQRGTIAWNGSELAVVWTDNPPPSPIHVQRFDPSLAPLGARIDLAATAYAVRVTSLGSDFAVAWWSTISPSQIGFLELTATGVSVGSPATIQLTQNLQGLDSVFTTSQGYVFAVLDANLHPSVVHWQPTGGMTSLVSLGGTASNDLARGATNLGEAWTVSGTTRFVPVGDDGTLSAAVTLAAPAFSFVDVAWDGTTYRVLGLHDNGTEHVIQYSDLDASGSVLVPTAFSSMFTSSSWGQPTSVGAAGRYAFALSPDAATFRVVQLCP